MNAPASKAPVVTPDEDPAGYALDWRYQTAAALSGNPPVKGETADDVVAAWLKFMRQDKRLPAAERERLTRVQGWNNGAMGVLLRALLLTETGYGEVAGRVGVKSEDVRLFERSFFDVRLPSGELRPRLLLNARFSTGDGSVSLPIRAALQAGTAGVEASFGIGNAQGGHHDAKAASQAIRALAGQQLMTRLLGGRVETKDLVRIQQLSVMEEAAAGAVSESETQAVELLHKMLELCKPERVPVEDYAQHIRGKTHADSQRAAQSTVDAFGAKGGAAPLKKPADYDPVKEKRKTANYQRDIQDLRVAGPDGKPVLAFPGS